MHLLKTYRKWVITGRFEAVNSGLVPQVWAAGHYPGQGGSVRGVHSVLVLLRWWSGQQLARLTEFSNVRSSPLREDGAPAVHSFPSLPPSIPPSPLQVLWAPLGSHPSLSHTGPIIGPAHKLVGLQMGRACRTYMVSAAWTKTCKSDHKNMWSAGCGDGNVFDV